MPAPADRHDWLFLCVANSARSQMAEGWARHLGRRDLGVHSAGSQPTGLNPYAVAAMHEIGIDISEQDSKPVESVPVERVGVAVTLCADEVCPIAPAWEGIERLHWPFQDPAATSGSSGEILERFREVREAIGERVRNEFEARGLLA